MKKTIIALAVVAIMLLNGCVTASTISTNQPLPTENLKVKQDKDCRETIQKLYTIETYCPDNFKAYQDLFTDSFNKKDLIPDAICQTIQSFKIVKLLPPDDPDFPPRFGYKHAMEYYVEYEVHLLPGKSMPGSCAPLWYRMKINDAGQCKVDGVSNGT